MKNVMTRAWEIAREGVKKFGGKVKEFFAQALVIAWSETKKGVNKMEVYTWKNANGVEFELHAEHVTKSTRTTGIGVVIEKDENYVRIVKFLIDGQSYKQGMIIEKTVINGTNVLSLGRVNYKGQAMDLMIALPENVNNGIWAAYEAKKEAKKAAADKRLKKEVAEMEKKIAHGYCPKCHSYCWGDCGQ